MTIKLILTTLAALVPLAIVSYVVGYRNGKEDGTRNMRRKVLAGVKDGEIVFRDLNIKKVLDGLEAPR